jgi:hypothetical protein
MMNTRRLAWIVTLIPLPVLIATALFSLDTFAAMTGPGFLFPSSHLTLADALALRNTGEVAFQLLNGVDPNQPSLLVQAAPGGKPRQALPVDVAIRTGEVDLLELLIRHGTRMDEAVLVRLRCEADRIGENRIVEWIDARLARAIDCDRQ